MIVLYLYIMDKRESLMDLKKENKIRLVLLCAFALFSLSCAVWSFTQGSEGWGLAVATVGILFSPFALEKLLGVRFSLGFVIWGFLYAVGPMLGHTLKLYYMLSWWDGLLHFFGGIAFAVVGWILPRRMGVKCSRAFNALFAVVFSMAIALGWEFIEYAADTFFGRDMQSDAFINSITSFLLSPDLGKMGSIEHIDSVLINGTVELPGLIDTGIRDTMSDTLVETLGAILVAAGLSIFGESILFRENDNG